MVVMYMCMCYHDYSVTESTAKRRCGMCHVPYSVTQPPFKVQLSKCLVCKLVTVCICIVCVRVRA